MKIIGSLLCIAGIISMLGPVALHSSEPLDQKIQDYALGGVLLAIGIPLSQGRLRRKEKDK